MNFPLFVPTIQRYIQTIYILTAYDDDLILIVAKLYPVLEKHRKIYLYTCIYWLI